MFSLEIKKEQLAMNTVEEGEGGYCFEASNLGLPPGQVMPTIVTIEGESAQSYYLRHTQRQDGDILGWEYEASDGEPLTILND